MAQTLNKQKGDFTKRDLTLLEAMTTQGTLALQSAQFIERMKAVRKQEMEFLDIVSEITSDIKLGSLLQKVMGEATRMLNAERSTLFLNDEKTNELWSEVGQGLESMQIRLPNHLGIAGAVFTSGKTINIPYAYADLRFNPAFDKKTGFFTRSILCVPIVNKHGKIDRRDAGAEQARRAVHQRGRVAAAGLHRADLDRAGERQAVRRRAEDEELQREHAGDHVERRHHAGRGRQDRHLQRRRAAHPAACGRRQILQRPAAEFFAGANAWVLDKLKQVDETGSRRRARWTRSSQSAARSVSVNVTVLPLHRASTRSASARCCMIEDISSEKRMKSTMSRYMDPGIADQLLATGAETARRPERRRRPCCSPTSAASPRITEELGAQGTVALLNEYFTLMVDCIQQRRRHARQVHRRRDHGRPSASRSRTTTTPTARCAPRSR